MLVKRDFDNPLWDTYGEKPAEGVDGDPKLAPYVYGIFIYPEYLREKESRGSAENYDMVKFLIDKNMMTELFMNKSTAKDYEDYKRQAGFINWNPIKASGRTFESLINEFGEGFRETADFILGLRTVSYIFTTLSVVIGYFIVLALTKSLPLSILTAVFYGASRIVASSTYYARTEGLFLFLFNLGILFLIVIVPKKVSSKLLLVAFALASALCNQTKLNGVLLVFMFSLLAFFTKVLRSNYGETAKKWLFNILLVNLLFVPFYISLNPSLYKNTLRNLGFQYSWTYKVAQVLQRRTPEDRLDAPIERARFVFQSFFKKQGELSLVYSKQGSYVIQSFGPLLLIFFIVGLADLVRRTVNEGEKFFKSTKFSLSKEAIFFVSIFLIFISTLFYLLLAWERYLVVLVLPTWFVIFYGARVVLDFNKIKLLSKRR